MRKTRLPLLCMLAIGCAGALAVCHTPAARAETIDIPLNKVTYIDGAYNENLGAQSTIKNVVNAADHAGITAGTATRSLLGMPSVTVPVGEQIESVSLNLWCTQYNTNGAATPFSMVLYPLTTGFVEGTGTKGQGSLSGATWNTYDGTDPWVTPGGGGDFDSTLPVLASAVPGINAWTTFDLTNLWKNTNLQTHGAELTVSPENPTLVPAGTWVTESFASNDWVNSPGTNYNPYLAVTLAPVPEPSAAALLAAGVSLAAIGFGRRLRSTRQSCLSPRKS